MPDGSIEDFRRRRAEGQARLSDTEHLGLKRFLRLDHDAYADRADHGRLDGRTKELLGLVASAVLRCDDCIVHHVEQCVRMGWTKDELEDALNVALVVGGSITIPHLRRARVALDELLAEDD